METPVLLIVFNRLETVQKVLSNIKLYRPKRLFVASDGARNSEELLIVENVREFVLNNVDWDCKVETKFNNINLGCKLAVSSAISWFFQHVEAGIILEDDCVPSKDFFRFCELGLEFFRAEKNIMHINGSNIQNKNTKDKSNYYESIYCHVWGWATWKDRWDLYDAEMDDYEELEQILSEMNFKVAAREYWRKIFYKVRIGELNTWDYQWVFTVWKNKGIAVTPTINLITNIGFNSFATHTVNSIDYFSSRRSFNFSSLSTFTKNPNGDFFDRKSMNLFLGNFPFRWRVYLKLNRILIKIKRLI